MKKFGCWLTAAAAVLLLLVLPVTAYSVEPPCLTVYAVGAPKGMELALTDPAGTPVSCVTVTRETRGWETRYIFRYDPAAFVSDVDLSNSGPSLQVQNPSELDLTQTRLAVMQADGTVWYVCTFPESSYPTHNNAATLNIRTGELSSGVYAGRTALIVLCRTAGMFLIQMAVFACFGYRRWRSWLVFCAESALTLIWLQSQAISVSADYLQIGVPIVVLLSIPMLLIGSTLLCIFIREKDRGYTFAAGAVLHAAGIAACVLMLYHLPLAR